MLDRYIDFINHHLSDTKDKKLLLGVSGGVDSMVMLDLSIQAGLDIAVAHIDHGMRGKSSVLDAKLVKDTCNKANITYHQYTFSIAEKTMKSFQENARNIRYRWWNELCEKFGYDYIFTAHHSSDSVETFFLNLSRGAGIRGLTGIPVQNLNIFRPLSSVTKEEIQSYANENRIAFREDESNKESKYKRNIVRNEWLPHLQKYDIDIENKVSLSIRNLKRERELLESLVSKEMSKYLSTRNTRYISIDLDMLKSENQSVAVHLLYQYLRTFGFSYDTCDKCFNANTGSVFHSDISELLKDRGSLLLRAKVDDILADHEISGYGQTLINGAFVQISQYPKNNSLAISNLEFPFKIRTRKDGDRFKPGGMNGSSKKVKDYLTDLKLDKWTKQETLVIEKNEIIVAVYPYRVAHGYDNADQNDSIYINLW